MQAVVPTAQTPNRPVLQDNPPPLLQLRTPPQPSEITPHVTSCAVQVVGTHGGLQLRTPPQPSLIVPELMS